MSPRSILLFENDINLRQSIALILQRAGYIVSTSDYTSKVLELLHNKDFHLLIADVSSPETSSDLLPKVLKFFPYLPIVILTDQSSAEAEMESRLFSAYYLIKPVAPERLLDYVGSILGRKTASGHENHHGYIKDRA